MGTYRTCPAKLTMSLIGAKRTSRLGASARLLSRPWSPIRDERIVTHQRKGSGAGQGICFELSAKDGVEIYPWRAGPLPLAWRSVRQIASRMPAGSQRQYRHRHVFVHCGQSLQSMIPIMIIEPAATTTEQITGNSSRTAITAARPLWFRAKRQLATPIRNLRLAPVASF